MAASVFIGDETTAAGFRLAGFDIVVPSRDETGEALAAAQQHADLILITAACARDLPDDLRDETLREKTPLILIIPDINASVSPPDMEARIRRTLGIERCRMRPAG